MDCLFCAIVKKQKPAYIVFEDEKTLAFLDVFPSVTGHVLVIPKKHGATVLDFTREDLGFLWETVKKLIIALEKTCRTTIFTIGINHDEPRGVAHLHVHILPRFEDDKGGIIQTVVKKEITEDLKTISEKIKKNIFDKR